MSFDNLAFFLLAFAAFLLSRPIRTRLWVYLLASAAFYAFAGWRDLALLAGVVGFNYCLSFRVERARGWLIAVVATDILVLAFFKYRAFLLGAGLAGDLFVGAITIPLGISFYTFQLIAYQVDVATGRVPLVRSFFQFASFALFFPQLVSGPISRAEMLSPQWRCIRNFRPRRLRFPGYGLLLCLQGVVKKVVLADALAPHLSAIFTLGPADAMTAWLGAFLFGFQLYFDFSGYSDIAIGVAFLLGLRLPFNFRRPFLAVGPQAFWRRWHITLSDWIRDYVFIPLAGAAPRGKAWRDVTLVATMGLMGLWHGAGWTFIWWGVAWGMYLVVWHGIRDHIARLGRGAWLLHMVIVSWLWVLFRSPDMPFAGVYTKAMFGAGVPGGAALADDAAGFASWIALATLCVVLHWGEERIAQPAALMRLRRLDGPVLWGFTLGVIFLLFALPKSNMNPFLYFRF